MGGTTIEVAGWGDLEGLVEAMDGVGEQMRRTTSYAVGEVCRPAGFATSPACLLRPLAEVMDRVGQAFDDAGRAWYDDWRRLRDATHEAVRDLEASDRRSVALTTIVATKLDRAA